MEKDILNFDFEQAYNEAPQKIKDLLDEYEGTQDYKKLEAMRKKFLKLGYDLEYGLDGCIFWIGPLPKD